MLPVCGQTDLSAGQLSLLATLRKFLVKAVSTPHPDRDAANAVATKLAELLGGLCSSCCSSGNSQTSDSCCVLLQHAATHLLPALQVSSGGPLFSIVHRHRGGLNLLCLSVPFAAVLADALTREYRSVVLVCCFAV